MANSQATIATRPAEPGQAIVNPSASAPGQVLAAVRARAAQANPAVPAAEVDRWILHFVGNPERRRSLEDALGRMARFEPLVRDALRRHGVPADLMYLPLIESEFVETAVSHAGAAGMWQFMPGTARLNGLEVSAYVDERKDPVRATDAAVRHLADLYRQFGSWHLSLAAYNAGPVRVENALRRHAAGARGDERLYWSIRPRLPSETRNYVPLFLAATEIARAPRGFGLQPRPAAALAFAEVWVPGGTPLDVVAREHGVSGAALRQLNPHLVRGMTPPGRCWPVRVPPRPPALTPLD
ncbi:lytic transglycosylase domain-containing protein [Longimicrobium sp.]|uniref:lytic transglycosylase domain-containing protein n=1 Tax=Longimicrobium sp. TaxID=2029185 RepID=UPI002E369D3D|nr:lytic transglycosylase domain-containing protein [Longimicrobium sp.]HEX6037790.1 lytic transglycosylase domain-containing protein [Longimicrobium sp.]